MVVVFLFCFVWFLWGRLQERERESDILVGRRRKESRVSYLLVALLTQHVQPALGQYLITCITEQHAISTY